MIVLAAQFRGQRTMFLSLAPLRFPLPATGYHSLRMPAGCGLGAMVTLFAAAFAAAASDTPPPALVPHPKAVPNIHAPGEVDRPEMVKFIVADPASLPGIVVDETAAELTGEWQYSTHTPPYVGLGYLHDMKAGKGAKSVTFTPTLPKAGWYEVRLAHCYNVRRSTRTPLTVHHADGNTTLRINQQEEPAFGRLFRSLGTFRFEAGRTGWARISTDGTEADKVVVVDAVQFLPVPGPAAGFKDSTSIGHFPGAHWQQWNSPPDAGFSPEGWQALAEDCQTSGAASVLVVYDGALLFQYGNTATRYMCHSVRKSLMSILVGIQIGKGRIDTTQTLAQLGIDDIQPQLTFEEKQATVLDLLTARSGVYHPAAYETGNMKEKRPERGSHPPGTFWWYNNWDFNALLTIFEKQTGTKFFESFQRDIAAQIGLEDFRLRDGYYHREPARSEHPAYPFQLSARDLARIGLLMASGGRWGDRQIIPQAWVTTSTEPHSTTPNWHGFNGYGCLWWTGGAGRDRVFSAQGVGGHSIDVMPGRKLVFVFRADTYRGKSINWKNREAIVRRILDAQNGSPVAGAQLQPVPDGNPFPQPTSLPAGYWQQFPLELRRELPPTMTKEIRDEPVRIELREGTPVLFTRRPPAMSFDLIPLAEDRFYVCDFGEAGVIERTADGMPGRFLFKSDLLRHAKALEAAGQKEAADGERSLAARLFPGGSDLPPSR